MASSLSPEQSDIVRWIREGSSCISDSVPGSGKTTTGISIAREIPDKRILCLTFSSSLKAEGRDRVLQLPNMSVESYNSCMLCYYGKGGCSKQEVCEILEEDTTPIKKSESFDILILDETQDMNILFYRFVRKFVRDMGLTPLYLVIGDMYQGVFEFLGADRRFLTLSQHLYDTTFQRVPLTRSFRLTDTMSQFLNKVLLGEDRIQTQNPTKHSVQYLIADPYSRRLHDILYTQIHNLMDMGAKQDDFFSLFAGMKPGPPAPFLDTFLSRKGLSIAFADSETENIREVEFRNKIVMTTFHKSKGRERKYVFVFNYDESYFQYYKPNTNIQVCPPELYVATSRATKCVWLIHGYTESQQCRQLPFCKMDLQTLAETPYCTVTNLTGKPLSQCTKRGGPIPGNINNTFNVTDIINYLSDECEAFLYPLIDRLYTTRQRDDGHKTSIPSTIVSQFDTSENITDLLGVAIPSYIGHTQGIRGDIHRLIDTHPSGYHSMIREIYDPPDQIEDHLRFANILKSIRKGTWSNIRQINRYHFLSEDNLKCCELNAGRIPLTEHMTFEYLVTHTHFHREFGEISLQGSIDAHSPRLNEIYEFKCTSALQFSHKLQLVIYAWILKQKGTYEDTQSYLFNFFTGELLHMDYREWEINQVMAYLFRDKFTQRRSTNDTEFLRQCHDQTDTQTLRDHVKKNENTSERDYEPTSEYLLGDSEEEETRSHSV